MSRSLDDVKKSIRQYLLECVGESYSKIICYVERSSEYSLGYNGEYFSNSGERHNLDVYNLNDLIDDDVEELYSIMTAKDANSKWNRATCTLTADTKLHIDFEWDQALADEYASYEDEAPLELHEEQPFLDDCMIAMQEQGILNGANWGLGTEERYHIDQEQGIIRFSFSNGRTMQASLQMVGTYNPQTNQFLWGWDHPSVPKALSRAASLVYDYGKEHSIKRFTEREIVCTEHEALELMAVATRLDTAQGSYKATTEGPVVYMTFGEVTQV